MLKELIGVEEISKLLGVPRSWIYQRTRTNQIPCHRIGKYIKFDIREIESWLASNRAEETNTDAHGVHR